MAFHRVFDLVGKSNDRAFENRAAVHLEIKILEVSTAGRGQELARRLDAGMISINSVLTYASIPGLPWGGTGDSGFGRIHGPDGLREFARSRAITSERFSIPL